MTTPSSSLREVSSVTESYNPLSALSQPISTYDPTLSTVTSKPAVVESESTESLLFLTTDNDCSLRAPTEKPETDMRETTAKPDITMYCGQCDRYIDLRDMIYHRTFHKSLQILNYKGRARPSNLKALVKRRINILNRLKAKSTSDSILDPQEIPGINQAYECLKADMEDTQETYRQVRENIDTLHVSAVSLNGSSGCVLAVGICSDANERWKNAMEDTRVFQDHFGNDDRKCFFGIYDGHHGRFAAEVAANELHHGLLAQMSKFDPRTKCTCTFNMADNYDISTYEIHTRAPTRSSERGLIHEVSSNLVRQIISTCETNLTNMHDNYHDNMEADDRLHGDSRAEDNPKDNTEVKDKLIKKKKQSKDPFSQKMAAAFTHAHKYTDGLLSRGKDELSRVRWSGCSTLCCVIESCQTEPDRADLIESSRAGQTEPHSNNQTNPEGSGQHTTNDSEQTNTDTKILSTNKDRSLKELGKIYIANAGNAHAVLVRGDKGYRLTRDHTPHNLREKARVLKQGGTVNESDRELRVNGVLATTRGLGNHGDPGLRKCVTIEPYTTTVKIDQYAQFLILASNGVWEVLSEQEAADIILQMFPGNQIPAPSRISTSIRELLVDEKSHVTDDNQSVSSCGRNNDVTYGRVFGTMGNEPKLNLTNQSGTKKHLVNEYITRGCHGDDSLSVNDGMQTEVGSYVNLSEDDWEYDADGEVTSRTESLSLGEFSVKTDDERRREFAKVLTERLIQSALLAGSRDNITAMVILLPGCKI